MNEEIVRALLGENPIKAVRSGRCPFCHEIIKDADFRDVPSVKEYKISGLCQACQDKAFGV